jgi:hypothetical protein
MHDEAEATDCVNEPSSALHPQAPHEYAPMQSYFSEEEGSIALVNRMLSPAAPRTWPSTVVTCTVSSRLQGFQEPWDHHFLSR